DALPAHLHAHSPLVSYVRGFSFTRHAQLSPENTPRLCAALQAPRRDCLPRRSDSRFATQHNSPFSLPSLTSPLLPSRTPRSAYSFSSRSPAASDKTARRSCPPRHAVRGTSNNSFPSVAASPSLHHP